MLNFEFVNPTKIVFGKETIAQIDRLIPADAGVMVLYGGGSIKKNGTLDEVRAALGKRTYQEFGGIEPNPTYETLMKAVEQIRQEKLDFLLAVGGGSVVDGTKFVAAAVPFEGDTWRILETHGQNVHQALPFASVLTLPATGSEMNNGAVITRKATHTKLSFMSPHVFPVFSILDPTKTYTLPSKQIANGVVDAFVHITEQYLNYPVEGKIQDRFAEGLLLTLIEEGPRALQEPDNYAVRANIMWAATWALNGMIGAGVPQDWATHLIGHEITAMHDLDHAQTLAIVLPSLLTEKRAQKREKLLQYAQRVWGLTEGSEDERIEAAINATRAFFEQMGIQTRLTDYLLDGSSIPALVKKLTENKMTKLGEHGDITPEVSQRILEASI